MQPSHRYFDAHGNYYFKDKEAIQDTWLEGVDWNKVIKLCRERVCVCVCVCVREREREREGEYY